MASPPPLPEGPPQRPRGPLSSASHGQPSTASIPALLRTPPSSANLAAQPITPVEEVRLPPTGFFPPPGPPPAPVQGTTSSRPYDRFGTVPFPSSPRQNNGGNSSSSGSQKDGRGAGHGMVMSESNISERPDTLASLSLPPTRGRMLGRPSLASRNTVGGRTSSDSEKGAATGGMFALPSLTPSTSRDGDKDPKKVSFDNDSLQHGNGEPSGLKRISSSLERIKHFIRPGSDPNLPSNPNSQPPSRNHSPHRWIPQLRRNPHFWPPTPTPHPITSPTSANHLPTTRNREAGSPPFRWSRPCDPYDTQSSRIQQQSRRQSSQYKPPPKPSVGSIIRSIPGAQASFFWLELWVRQIYRHCLLRVPSMYFKRVWRIIFEAQVTRSELDALIQQRMVGGEFPIAEQWIPPVVSPGLARFRNEWEWFIDQLLKEWKTFNVVSALLLSAILTIFQIDGTDQPVTRTAALAALVSGLWSIVFGGVYVIRFQSMKDMVKASRWAEAAQETIQDVFWNVWVFLSLPAVSLAYSVIFFCVSVLSYVWTAGTAEAPSPIATNVAWIPRVIITVGFFIGAVYFVMVIRTFRSYSDPWPSPVVDMSYLSPQNSSAERGRIGDIQREARERRSSLRRFGSPDVYFRPPVAHSAPQLGTSGASAVALGLEVMKPPSPPTAMPEPNVLGKARGYQPTRFYTPPERPSPRQGEAETVQMDVLHSSPKSGAPLPPEEEKDEEEEEVFDPSVQPREKKVKQGEGVGEESESEDEDAIAGVF